MVSKTDPSYPLQWETQLYLGDVIGTVQDELVVSSWCYSWKKRQACSERCASLLSCVTIDPPPHSDFYFWVSFQDLSDCRLPLRT